MGEGKKAGGRKTPAEGNAGKEGPPAKMNGVSNGTWLALGFLASSCVSRSILDHCTARARSQTATKIAMNWTSST